MKKNLTQTEILSLSPDAQHMVKSAVFFMLIESRMSNYGYSRTDYSRISAQRQRAKIKLYQTGYSNIKIENFLQNNRVEIFVDSYGLYYADYVTGQSNNEEITNVIRRLVKPNAVWQA